MNNKITAASLLSDLSKIDLEDVDDQEVQKADCGCDQKDSKPVYESTTNVPDLNIDLQELVEEEELVSDIIDEKLLNNCAGALATGIAVKTVLQQRQNARI
jgi:hypothetical protein